MTTGPSFTIRGQSQISTSGSTTPVLQAAAPNSQWVVEAAWLTVGGTPTDTNIRVNDGGNQSSGRLAPANGPTAEYSLGLVCGLGCPVQIDATWTGTGTIDWAMRVHLASL